MLSNFTSLKSTFDSKALFCEKSVLNEIAEDKTVWEAEPLRNLSDQGELSAWRHDGFWQPMDTLRDRNRLDEMWHTGSAPWKIW